MSGGSIQYESRGYGMVPHISLEELDCFGSTCICKPKISLQAQNFSKISLFSGGGGWVCKGICCTFTLSFDHKIQKFWGLGVFFLGGGGGGGARGQCCTFIVLKLFDHKIQKFWGLGVFWGGGGGWNSAVGGIPTC